MSVVVARVALATSEGRTGMGFWGTYIVGRWERSLLELPALRGTEESWHGRGADGWQAVQVHHGPDGFDSRDLPAPWEATLTALMAQSGNPVLAAVVMDSDGAQLIGHSPVAGRWGGWLDLERIIGHIDSSAWPPMVFDDDGYPLCDDNGEYVYANGADPQVTFDAAVARLSPLAGPPGSLAAPQALAWAAEAGLQPDPAAVTAALDGREVFVEELFFTLLRALGVPDL
jgi:hypothetical protein